MPVLRSDDLFPYFIYVITSLFIFSNSLPIKFHWRARSINFQRPIRSHGVRTNKNPVLPSRQPPENTRLKSLVDPEPQIRLKSRQRIRRKRRARFECLPKFILPV